jgi:hypothetical protein
MELDAKMSGPGDQRAAYPEVENEWFISRHSWQLPCSKGRTRTKLDPARCCTMLKWSMVRYHEQEEAR